MQKFDVNQIKEDDIQDGKMLLVDKPLTWTSFDVVKYIRKSLVSKFKIKRIKVGHAGTLDPLATGLLIICIGKQTKQISIYVINPDFFPCRANTINELVCKQKHLQTKHFEHHVARNMSHQNSNQTYF